MSISHKTLLFALFGVPLAALGASYAYLAILHGTLNLLPVVVHESGDYTLLQTILYVRHFMREAIVCVTTSLACAAAFWLYLPEATLGLQENARRRWALICYGVASCVFTASFMASLVQQGLAGTLLDLFQYRTRDTFSEFGSHWQYHLLHVVFIAAATVFLAGFLRFLEEGRETGRGAIIAGRSGPLVASLIFIVLLTLTFDPSTRPFSNALFLAHAGREIATHSVLSVPLLFGVLLVLEQATVTRIFGEPASANAVATARGLAALFGSALVACATAGYILIQLASENVLGYAQKQSSYWDLLASHSFEHSLDYVFMAFLTAAIFLSLLGRLKREDAA